jgi:putative endonuclease
MEKQFYVYIMTNWKDTVLYTGVTSNLQERIYQHRVRLIPGFTSRYNLDKLVYFEELPDATSAIAREKQITGGSKQKKMDLVSGMNPKWKDLYEEL